MAYIKPDSQGNRTLYTANCGDAQAVIAYQLPDSANGPGFLTGMNTSKDGKREETPQLYNKSYVFYFKTRTKFGPSLKIIHKL